MVATLFQSLCERVFFLSELHRPTSYLDIIAGRFFFFSYSLICFYSKPSHSVLAGLSWSLLSLDISLGKVRALAHTHTHWQKIIANICAEFDEAGNEVRMTERQRQTATTAANILILQAQLQLKHVATYKTTTTMTVARRATRQYAANVMSIPQFGQFMRQQTNDQQVNTATSNNNNSVSARSHKYNIKLENWTQTRPHNIFIYELCWKKKINHRIRLATTTGYLQHFFHPVYSIQMVFLYRSIGSVWRLSGATKRTRFFSVFICTNQSIDWRLTVEVPYVLQPMRPWKLHVATEIRSSD